MGKLEGKIALVTGAGSGIGRRAALTFGREFAKVVAADINLVDAEDTAHLIEKAGGETLAAKVDVSKATDIESLLDLIVETYGHIDCAFNNAGVGSRGKFAIDYGEEEFDQTIAVNLSGVWLSMKYEIPHMIRQGGGAIVNAGSIMGLVGIERSAGYVASKYGVVGLTKAAALEYARSGIRINSICPGVIDTPMNQKYWMGDLERREQSIGMTPTRRLGSAQEIAEIVVWLCSDAASFVHGHSIVADGGWLAH